ncbi:MAG: hypothetical protein RI902_371 [Pseudomonadota bacterium]|jgi:8-oxo-dGTP pyrophosphatase MutT (NUDIX family)
MKLNSEVVTTPPRASATVVLLRDVPHSNASLAGLEVFLLRRHTDSAVLGGAYVFPGGKLDDADCVTDLHARLDQSVHQLHAQLAEPELAPSFAAGLYVAAVREALEECGVLYARTSASQAPNHTHQQRQQWQRLLHEGASFADLLSQEGLQLDTQPLAPWSRWITPVVPSVTNKRFDTRFFVAALPAGQSPVHDNLEAIDSVWLSPRAALERYWARELSLAPPQIMTLSSLARFHSVADVLRAAKSRKPPCVLPEPFDENGVRTICYPGDPRHSVREPAFEGPSRLRFVDGRFEPHGGLAALLTPVV